MGGKKQRFPANLHRPGAIIAQRARRLKLAQAPRPCPLHARRNLIFCSPGTEAGRKALLHAVAHIELNAVDLHWDIIARFTHIDMPIGFYDDWVKAADE